MRARFIAPLLAAVAFAAPAVVPAAHAAQVPAAVIVDTLASDSAPATVVTIRSVPEADLDMRLALVNRRAPGTSLRYTFIDSATVAYAEPHFFAIPPAPSLTALPRIYTVTRDGAPAPCSPAPSSRRSWPR